MSTSNWAGKCEEGRRERKGTEREGRRIARISPPAETDGRSLRATNFEAAKEEEKEEREIEIFSWKVHHMTLGKFFAAEWKASIRKWPRERIHSRISCAFCSPKNKRASLPPQPTNNLVSPVEERESSKKRRRGQNATLISLPPSLPLRMTLILSPR